jgi:hypothetical protein
MNNRVEMATRLRFRDWLRAELRDREFYQRRGDLYLIREFKKHCDSCGYPIDEASLGRYINRDEPVLPTPERCRWLAYSLEYSPLYVLALAGYIIPRDFGGAIPDDMPPSMFAEMLHTGAIQMYREWSGLNKASDELAKKRKAK